MSSQEETAARARRVSLHTVERLSVYRRKLEELSHEGVEFVHSHQLAAMVGVTPAQLRRDLTSFGTYGNIARGYEVASMIVTLSRILGTDKFQNVGLVGVGDLGRALLSYRGFEERGFRIVAAFDIDPAKIGKVIAGQPCLDLEELERVIVESDIRILILASRPQGLKEIIERACAVGVRAFLNFVPKAIPAPPCCHIEQIDLSAKLEKLSFLLKRAAPPPDL